MYIPYLFKDGKYGLFNTENSLAHKREYESISFFPEDGFYCAQKEGVYFYVSVEGKELKTSNNYAQIYSFNKGIACVKKPNGYWSFINKNGIELTDKNYTEAYDIYDDFISVYGSPTKYQEGVDGRHFPIEIPNGLVDRTGFEIVAPRNTLRFTICPNEKIIVNNDIIDFNGNVIGYNEFSFVSEFYEGRAIAMKDDYKEKSFFIVNSELQSLIQIKDCTALGDIDEGMAVIQINNKWGVIKFSGDWVQQCTYDKMIRLEKDIIIIEKNEDGMFHFNLLNKNGEELLKNLVDEIRCIGGDYFKVKKGEFWGIINKKGDLIVEYEYSEISYFEKCFFIIGMGDKNQNNIFIGKYGVIKSSSEKVLPAIYKSVKILNEKLLMVEDDFGFSIYKSDGTLLSINNNTFDRFIETNGNYHLIEYNNKRFLIDNNGNRLIEDDSNLPF